MAIEETALTTELVAVFGAHTPVYSYEDGFFLMDCEACDFKLWGRDREEAKQRFGEHFASLAAEFIAARVAEALEAAAAHVESRVEGMDQGGRYARQKYASWMKLAREVRRLRVVDGSEK